MFIKQEDGAALSTEVCWCRLLQIISGSACMLSAAALLTSSLEAALQAIRKPCMRLFSRPSLLISIRARIYFL